MNSKDIEKGTISIAFVQEALVCLKEHGIDERVMLMQAGISPELLTAPQARVSSSHYGVLWHSIAQSLDDEFFGLDSHRMKAGSFTLLCHSLIHSDTLERALRRALRFLRLVLDDFAGELEIENGIARIRVKDRRNPLSDETFPPKRAFAYGTYLLMLHGLACWLVGRRIPLINADFRCEEPSFSSEWRILFSQNLNFSQPDSGIVFSADYLAMVNVQNERTMKEFLRSAPANFLVKYKNSASLSAQIRRRLRQLSPAAWPDFATLAKQLNLSQATLRRRMDDEGESYRNILDDLRRDLAIGLLSDSRKNLAEIAETLGFSETSAFHRAFKKWTGARPSEYRSALNISM
jgi:AraC-like DNA-binding protein